MVAAVSLARFVGQVIRAEMAFAFARGSDRIEARLFLAIGRAGWWRWGRWGCLRAIGTIVPPGHGFVKLKGAAGNENGKGDSF